MYSNDNDRRNGVLASRRKYNNSINGRLQTARVSQRRRNGLGYLLPEDDLTLQDLYDLLEEQNYCSAVSGIPFTDNNWEISHIVAASNGGNLTKSNLELVLPGENPPGRNQKNVMHIQSQGIMDFLGKWMNGQL